MAPGRKDGAPVSTLTLGGAPARRAAPVQRPAGRPGRRRQLPLARRAAPVGQALIGWYRSTDAAVRSRGTLYLALHQHGNYALGRWVGMSYDGPVVTGWGAIGRTEPPVDSVGSCPELAEEVGAAREPSVAGRRTTGRSSAGREATMLEDASRAPIATEQPLRARSGQTPLNGPRGPRDGPRCLLTARLPMGAGTPQPPNPSGAVGLQYTLDTAGGLLPRVALRKACR